MPKHQHQCGASVNGCAKANPGCDHGENSVIDIEKEHRPAKKRKRERCNNAGNASTAQGR